MFAMFLYITLYIQNTLGFSPQQTGLRFLPLTVVSFFVAPAAGRVSRTVPVRALFGLGMALVGTGLLLMSNIDASSKWTALLPGFILAGAGDRDGESEPRAGRGRRRPTAALGDGQRHQLDVPPGRDRDRDRRPRAVFQGILTNKIPNVPGEVLATGNPNLVRGVPHHAYLVAYSDALSTLFLIAAIIAFVAAVLSLALTRQSDFIVQGAPEAAPAG